MTTSVAEIISRQSSFPELAVLLGRIRATYKPEEVLLFGSRARGTADENSDWDLIVIVPDDADEALLDPSLGWKTQAGSGVHADVICAYRSEFLADIKVANSRTREVVEHAVRLATC